MKNNRIFTKDWLELHPYTQSTEVDSYYTTMANCILDIMEETQLTNSLTKEEAKRTAIGMAAYFEDMASQLNIWRSFINEHKRLYGKYLPFYDVDDHYYDDEVNLEDTKFLLWHFLQQLRGFRKGTFLSPDNETTAITAEKIYKLFCNEWTHAPENEKMKGYFSDEHRLDLEEITDMAIWFYFYCYLFPQADNEFKDYAVEQLKDPKSEFKADNLMVAYAVYAENEPTLLLGYTSIKWLSMIVPQTHPDYAVLADYLKSFEVEEEEYVKELRKVAEEESKKFDEAANGKVLLYFKSSDEAKAFIKENIDESHKWLEEKLPEHLALGATKENGLEMIFEGFECFKDETNPFYNQEIAKKNALSFFMVPNITTSLLERLESNGMLADATAKSVVSEERGRQIIHENQDFIKRYFIRGV